MDDFVTRQRSLSLSDNKTAEVFLKSRKTERSPTRKRKERETEANMEEIAQMLKSLTVDMSDMRKDMKKGNEDLKKTMEDNITQMRKMIEETRQEVAEIKEKEQKWEVERKELVAELKTKEIVFKKEIERSQILEKRIAQLEEKDQKAERERRRNNVVIKRKVFNGNNIREEVKDFLKNCLEVDAGIKEAYNIKGKEGKIVQVKLDTWEQKMAVCKAKYKLRQLNEEIYIDNDLTKLERETQREIRKIAEQEKKKGNQVKTGYQKLMINNKWFYWNTETSTLKESTAKN